MSYATCTKCQGAGFVPGPSDLVEMRERAGKIQADMARIASVSPTFISYVEKGERPPGPRVLKAYLGLGIRTMGATDNRECCKYDERNTGQDCAVYWGPESSADWCPTMINREASLSSMEVFGIKQVGPNASRVVRTAEEGNPVLITRHNRPSVVVVPVAFYEAAVKAMASPEMPPQGVGRVGG